MRKLTNLQMGVIVDKVYKELKKKIDVINKERLEKVNIDRELKEDTKLKLLREYYEYDRLSREYEELMSVVKKANIVTGKQEGVMNDRLQAIIKDYASILNSDGNVDDEELKRRMYQRGGFYPVHTVLLPARRGLPCCD